MKGSVGGCSRGLPLNIVVAGAAVVVVVVIVVVIAIVVLTMGIPS